MIGDLLDFFASHQTQILRLTGDHIALTASAIGLAIAIGLPLAIASVSIPSVARWSLAFANLAQCVPSIALLGLAVPIFGIGFAPAIVALTLRALLPIYLNAYTGLKGIDPALAEADLALGLDRRQSLLLVRLPLALPAILGGVRTAAVEGVAVTTLAAFVGAGGLGDLILQGIAMMDPVRLFAGALPAALLAMTIELGLALVERLAARGLGVRRRALA
ncbi:ABC transporter permease [Acuticoccus kandeliae]|uniref:ABC transporter permease n=1 Tax=Acuticoccus kandeliae TaxID=2073160 RepID=UPI000D3EC6D5|nr:ABC transporter permease [Acuticoccus kandeliae]